MLKQIQLMLAHQFAIGKDRFEFYKYFYGFSLCGLLARAFNSRNSYILAPLVLLSFVFAYQWDIYCGNKMNRVRKDAEEMIKNNPELFYPAYNNMILSEEEYKEVISKF